MSDLVACVDFGSTFTKALLVDTGSADLVAAAEVPTTRDTDVLDGWRACRDTLTRTEPAARRAPVLACSSAGGGLRIAVIGNEELVTAEAGRRVALSSGGTVVHVGADGLEDEGFAALVGSRPDVVLLAGGTDGGNAEVVLNAAGRLAAAHWEGPVVVACNAAAAVEVHRMLMDAGIDAEVAANVVPQIGVLEPTSARAAIREMFLRHVIGGKCLSTSADFLAMVQGPTPDIVLSGVELLAASVGDVAVVDVGGATTDVYSVVEVDTHESGPVRQVVPAAPVARTVEGDLGMRWSAETTVASALAAGLVAADEQPTLLAGARERASDVTLLPAQTAQPALDLRLAELAVGVALRRHAGRQRVVFGVDGRLLERTGTDLREVALLIGSGGVLRHASPGATAQVLAASTGSDVEGGWLIPRSPRIVVDGNYVLAAVGLLRGHHDGVAGVLVDTYLANQAPVTAAATDPGSRSE